MEGYYGRDSREGEWLTLGGHHNIDGSLGYLYQVGVGNNRSL